MEIKANRKYMQQRGAPCKMGLRLIENLMQAVFRWYKTMLNRQGNVRYDIKQCLMGKEMLDPTLTTIK